MVEAVQEAKQARPEPPSPRGAMTEEEKEEWAQRWGQKLRKEYWDNPEKGAIACGLNATIRAKGDFNLARELGRRAGYIAFGDEKKEAVQG